MSAGKAGPVARAVIGWINSNVAEDWRLMQGEQMTSAGIACRLSGPHNPDIQARVGRVDAAQHADESVLLPLAAWRYERRERAQYNSAEQANGFGLVCPKCGSGLQIDIAARVWVRVDQDGTSAMDARDGSHEWDGASFAVCCACDHCATVADFRPVADPTNEDRVARARKVLAFYAETMNEPQDEAHLRDLLTDLMHLAEFHRDDEVEEFSEALAGALVNFKVETGE